MDQSAFSAVVSARLDPVLAPRGSPYAAHENGVSAPGEPPTYNQDHALFHCDGVDAVADLMRRYPGWSTRLRAAYGPHEILCLDLWVQNDRGVRSWSFEGLEADVVAAAGQEAQQRLDVLGGGPLHEWVDQLGFMLDAYFTRLTATPPDTTQ